MAEYMKKSDVIAYIRNEAKEAQSAFEELGGESGIIAEAFNDLANDFSQGAVPYTTAEEAFAQIPSADVAQWISVKDRPPEDNDRVIAFRPYEAEVSAYRYSVMWGWALKTSVSHSGITHWMPLPEPPKGESDG